jgi:hypothetical protein
MIFQSVQIPTTLFVKNKYLAINHFYMNLFKMNLLASLLFLSAFVKAQTTDTVSIDNVIFQKVEIEANYPGGEQAWRTYLEKNLDASTPIKNSAPSGYYTVWIQFIVNKEGGLSDIKALTNFGYGMEAEVMRILRKSGKWNPAEQGGRYVKAYRKQPVTFVVQDESFSITTQTPHVLFTGVENTISIDVPKVKDEDLQFTISQGMIIKKPNGTIVAKVPRAGRAIIEIYNSRKNKRIGAASFEVRASGE